jgi:hypothetical protein
VIPFAVSKEIFESTLNAAASVYFWGTSDMKVSDVAIAELESH